MYFPLRNAAGVVQANAVVKSEVSPPLFVAMQNAVAAEIHRSLERPVSQLAEQDPMSPNFRFFELVRQPNPKQRKSYRTENRYLAPNPFTIRYAAEGTSIDEVARPRAGGVTVSLTDVLGRPLDVAVQRELAGGARKVLTVGTTSAVVSFSLKIHVTSRGEELRLSFDVDWIGVDGLQRRERILSDAFRVNTNLRRPDAPPRRRNNSTSNNTNNDDEYDEDSC